MPRTISISTDVYAAIWAERLNGEESEDEILRRKLGLKSTASPAPETETDAGGVVDSRNNVHFPKGFRAFRRYKGKSYDAVAQNGMWVRADTKQQYPTLNQLNASIADGNENIWNGNWKYHAEDGSVRSINNLRG